MLSGSILICIILVLIYLLLSPNLNTWWHSMALYSYVFLSYFPTSIFFHSKRIWTSISFHALYLHVSSNQFPTSIFFHTSRNKTRPPLHVSSSYVFSKHFPARTCIHIFHICSKSFALKTFQLLSIFHIILKNFYIINFLFYLYIPLRQFQGFPL